MDDKTQRNEIEEVMAPKISHFIIEDETPVDNFKWEKQQPLLTNSLYDSWFGVNGSSQFFVVANVGVEIEEVTASNISYLIIEDETPANDFPQEKESALPWIEQANLNKELAL